MSKVNKVLLIVGTVCVALGVIVGTTAFALARFDLEVLSTSGPYEELEYTALSANIDTIEFSGVSDDVRIQHGNVKTIEIEYWQNNEYRYTISEKSHTLKMEFSKWTARNWIGINLTGFENRGVTITVPETFTGTLNINSVSGEITLDAPSSLKDLDIDTVSGDVSFTCEDIGKMRVNGVSANLDFTCGAIGSARIDTVSGDVEFASDALGTLKFNSISGDLKGRIADKVDNYSINADTLSGDIDIPRVQRGGENSLSFDTLSGNVRIDFTK
jgi:hypothetical protein